MRKRYNIGIDEAGRGPLAGPVAVSAVRLPQNFKNPFPELRDGKRFKDSKKLNEKTREVMFQKMKVLKIDFTVSMVGAHSIDRIGITRAIARAIARSIRRLEINPKNSYIYLDGRLHAPSQFQQETLTGGDTRRLEIALASIAAKVTRDRYMVRQGQKFPQYGFDVHKGYGTEQHRKMIKKHGLSALHRQSFIGQ